MDITDVAKVWQGFSPNIRREVKKAKERFSLKVKEVTDAEEFYVTYKKTFERQKQLPPYSKDLVKKLFKECAKRECCKALKAYSENGQVHAVNFTIWDSNSAYYLLGGGDPELRTSGAASLLMWEMINLLSPLKIRFDFEGSMIEPIEKFFRNMGGVQVPYFQIKKSNHFLFTVKDCLLG
jgi:lipid II:glycine glycyltransferase (peptidoglycan interpeptide bridge formation enzyme)